MSMKIAETARFLRRCNIIFKSPMIVREGEKKLSSLLDRAKSASACLLGALMAAALAVAVLPQAAFAALDVANIKAIAQMQTDGALHVAEQRTYLFDEARSALIWPVTAMEADSKLDVSSVRFAHCTVQGGIDGDWTTLSPISYTSELRTAIEDSQGLAKDLAAATAGQGDAGTGSDSPIPDSPGFCVDPHNEAIYLVFPPTEGRVIFDCDLTVTDAVRVFDDVAELYWDYVPADPSVQASSVNVTFQLPMPEGMQAVPGQNVFAWGHGAAGSINVKADGTIAFHVPEVRPGQYAQAHIVFPQQWLTNLSLKAIYAHTGTRLDDAKMEEAAWTDTWSAWLANSFTVDIAFIAASILILAGALALWFFFGREPEPDGRAATDGGSLCMQYEAPVIRRLLRWDHASSADLVALIMQLISRRAVMVETLGEQGPLGCGYEDMRFRSSSHAKDLVRTPIDQEAFRLLFDVWGEGYASVTLTDIARHAKADASRFRQELAAWDVVLSHEVAEAHLFDERSARIQRMVLIAGCVCMVGALFFGVGGGSFVRGCALVFAGVGCLAIGNYLARRTPLGADIEASALALAAKASAAPSLDDIPDDRAPYAFAVGNALPRAGDAETLADIWLKPRTGRGGKPACSLADQLAKKLDEWG